MMGVLIATEELYLEATRETLAEVGVDLTLEQYVEISLRRGHSLMDLAAEAGADPDQVRQLLERRDGRYAARLEARRRCARRRARLPGLAAPAG